MIDKESVEQDKEVDNDWDIQEWFSSDTRGGKIIWLTLSVLKRVTLKPVDSESLILIRLWL